MLYFAYRRKREGKGPRGRKEDERKDIKIGKRRGEKIEKKDTTNLSLMCIQCCTCISTMALQ